MQLNRFAQALPLALLYLSAALAAWGCSACAKAPAQSPPVNATKPLPAQTSPSTPEVKAMPDATPISPARPATLPGQAKLTSPGQDQTDWSNIDWSKKLTPEQYYVLRQKGTERAFTGKYWQTKPPAEQAKDQTIYRCAGCGLELFRADSKFDSGCGWPSFDRMIQDGVIKEVADTSHGMTRTEVVCARCDGHLGHLFDDGPTNTGLRYCINSASINPDAKPQAKPAEPTPGKP